MNDRPTRIRSVRRAAAVLELVAQAPDGVTASAVAAALAIPLPTTYHLLSTLVDAGLLAKSATRRYRLGPAVALLADAYMTQLSAPAHLVERLGELAARTGETAYLSAWRGGDVVVLQIIEGSRAVRVAGLHLGYSGIAHARASGKAMLAFGPPGTVEAYLRTHRIERRTPRTVVDAEVLRCELERVRRMGYAVDEEEFAEGVACIAAPVADGTMAIGISAPVERYRALRARLVDAVVSVAESAQARRLATAAGA